MNFTNGFKLKVTKKTWNLVTKESASWYDYVIKQLNY